MSEKPFCMGGAEVKTVVSFVLGVIKWGPHRNWDCKWGKEENRALVAIDLRWLCWPESWI
jgi:hypothetical protein